jgi:transcriptional regulator with PAS, ATPase and Fis domain
MDVRFIFATNENLQQKVNEFLFRKDLYFRINTVEITIPPLRERLEDMSLFAQYFLQNTNTNTIKPYLFLRKI